MTGWKEGGPSPSESDSIEELEPDIVLLFQFFEKKIFQAKPPTLQIEHPSYQHIEMFHNVSF
jgi:hypothetical protein